MKAYTSGFKSKIKAFGRELDSIISYTSNGSNIELGSENLNSVTPHYEGSILKSVMKQLDIDSNIEIPLNTIINYQFGVKVRNQQVQNYRDNYDYVDFGNYVVYKVEKQEDTNSWKITCYDKVLYSMKEYITPKEYVETEDEEFVEDKVYYELINSEYVEYDGATTGNPSTLDLYEYVNITFPITIRSYIEKIANYLGLTFANANDIFVNYNKQINNELYLSSDGTSLDYTFRDVLDELAQVTASTICINEDDELEVRYINNTNEVIDEDSLKNINVNFGEKYGPINTIVLSRSAGADKIARSIPDNLPDEDKNAIEISDNQILNGNNRDEYITGILNQLYGLEYYINDFASTGITYLDLCDKYTIKIGENTYTCILFNDEVDITQGLQEQIYTEMPEESQTDYTKTDKTDRKINKAGIEVDKQNQVINAYTEKVDGYDGRISRTEARLDSQKAEIDIIGTNVNKETGDVEKVKVKGYVLDKDGLKISSEQDTFNALHDNTGSYYKDGSTILSQFTKNNTIIKNLVLYGTYYYGVDKTLNVANFTKDDAMFVAEKFVDENNEECFGHFWNQQ